METYKIEYTKKDFGKVKETRTIEVMAENAIDAIRKVAIRFEVFALDVLDGIDIYSGPDGRMFVSSMFCPGIVSQEFTTEAKACDSEWIEHYMEYK